MTNVLLIYDVFIPSVRLCGYEQMEYLQKQKKIDFIAADAKKLTRHQCIWADVVIFARSSTWLEYKLLKEFKKQKKYIIYVLDDDVFEVPKDSMVYDYFQMSAVRKRVKKNIELCDIFASPSKHLLQKYGKGEKVRIEEPSLFHLAEERKVEEKLKIGFAGSIDRNGDLENMLQEAIIEFYSKYKEQVEISFMGAKPKFVEQLGLNYIPYQENYEKYQEKLKEQNWSIGLAPMPDTEFHKGKHYNKYVEYASVGCVGIYSNVIPYTYQIKDKVNGILCENGKDGWIQAMEWCLNHTEKVEEIRKNIQKEVKEQFSIQATAEQFVKDLPELISYQAPRSRNTFVWWYRKISRVIRYFEFVIRNGTRVPEKLWEKIINK